jgi:hypothetical protein
MGSSNPKALTLDQIGQLLTTLRSIRDNTGENANVRGKAAEVLALFDAPSLSAIQQTFIGGTTAEKITALGQLQNALIRGKLT